ncbi:GNAT family N-acetyltransferase [Streptomyces sp. NPDC057386]|uniref:GNAT family N-acetyltransferase n=1 Tax=unclassified Streptomyces TaxID=2593676 RepID=UPI003627A80A
MSALTLREMTAKDCGPVAGIRVRGWQSAYRGLMPRSHLDAMTVAGNVERLRERLLRGDGTVTDLVAEAGGRIVGWACHGPYREEDRRTADAELYAIYVDPGHYGTGIGGRLLAESVRRCTSAGHGRMFLWVLKENKGARRFYERAGFTADGAEEPFEVQGVAVPEVRYVRDLTG